jgi:long-chain acyl-CoA synthetase
MTSTETSPQPAGAPMVEETLLAALARTVAEQGTSPALRWQDGGREGQMTWGEYADRAASVAAGLRELGVGRGDHVVLLLRNRPEFYWVDTACMLLGAIPVSVYLSPAVDRLADAIERCGAVACVAENSVFLDRVRAALPLCATARPRLIGIDEDTAAPDVVSIDDLYRAEPEDLGDAVAGAGPSDTVCMLYTSGTTGQPKGVPLTHANLRFATETLSARMGVSLAGRRQLSYLPMAHIGERLATHYLHMVQGSVVTCCPDLSEFPEILRETRPHMLFGAPRMWERLHEGIVARLDGGEDLTEVLADTGVEEIEVAIVGSAPLPLHVHQFWLEAGLPLADCYGQTETCGMGAWDPHDIAPGTCGRAFDGMELRIGDGGEIQLRGPAVFGGYFHDEAATSRVLDQEGWYHSGDLGRLDEKGNLLLVGRTNDVVVPTSGHNVSPAPIEGELRRIPCVGHAVVIGHGRPHLTAVLALDQETAPAWAAEQGRPGVPLAELAGDPELRSLIEGRVAALNQMLPGAERIRRFVIVPDVWALDSDVLTPTGKLRRSGVTARYADLVDSMYGRPGPGARA